ncbi:UNVERIFIED_ORG: putative DNA-binding transcriptional regulator AlpA [Pseudomonas fluorescens]|uniref:AlpA family phage regulatory protein n=1 Tax=Pseudomonas TaxID=286 RepID=UPI000ABC7260|nr:MULTISPECIES: AlpA family phage regulatory protein [Pseudomonas]
MTYNDALSTAKTIFNSVYDQCLPVSGGRTERAMNRAENIDRFLRFDEVFRTSGPGRNMVYRRTMEGTFPKQVRIGRNLVA